MKLLLLFFLTCAGAMAQLQTGVQYQFTDPAPACSPRAILVSNNLAGKLWQCKNGTYTDITGGGGGGGGTVTSVGFSTNLGTVTGSPVTTSGTLTNTVTGAQVVSLFTGCSGTQYLGADAACHNYSPGSGTVTSVGTTSPISGGTITTTGTISCPTCVTSAAALTANLPVFGAGSQAAAVGTRSGNTTEVGTVSGALTSGNCIQSDASGNLVDAGTACGGASSHWTLTGSDIYNNNAGNVGIGLTSGISWMLTVQPGTGNLSARFLLPVGEVWATCGHDMNIVGTASVDFGGQDCQGAYWVNNSTGTARKSALNAGGFSLASDSIAEWFSINNIVGAGSYDTGIGRNAAGVVEINNATLGTYRDLIARDVTVNSQAGGGTQCAKIDNTGKISGTGSACGGTSGGGHAFGATFSNSGATLSSGATAYFVFPFACTISAYNITTNPADTATLDIWKIASGTSLPTVANTIVASAPPTISTGSAVHSTTLTGWTTSVSANDIIGIHLTTVGGSSAQLTLNVECN